MIQQHSYDDDDDGDPAPAVQEHQISLAQRYYSFTAVMKLVGVTTGNPSGIAAIDPVIHMHSVSIQCELQGFPTMSCIRNKLKENFLVSFGVVLIQPNVCFTVQVREGSISGPIQRTHW